MRSRPSAAAPLQPPDLRDWLPEDHLAWFVIEAIEQLHLEPFYGAYRSAGHGRAAHEPKVEPVFANIKQNRRVGSFKRGGRAAVRSE